MDVAYGLPMLPAFKELTELPVDGQVSYSADKVGDVQVPFPTQPRRLFKYSAGAQVCVQGL